MHLPIFLEFLPLVAFFIIYKLYGLVAGTAVLVTAAALTILLLFFFTRLKIPTRTKIANAVVLVFGSLTLLTQDSQFIKMKPMAVFVFFAVSLGVGLLYRKHFLKHLLGQILELEPKRWTYLTIQWIFVFSLLAVLNELIWRCYGEAAWVNFKVFVVPGAMFIVFASQLYWFQDGLKNLSH